MCPLCLAEEGLARGHCRSCGAAYRIKGDCLLVAEAQYPAPLYYRFLKKNLRLAAPPPADTSQLFREGRSSGRCLRISGPARLRQSRRPFHFRGYRGWFSRSLRRAEFLKTGRLCICEKTLRFEAANTAYEWPAAGITALTTDGAFLEFKVKGQDSFQVRFLRESALKYELLLRRWLDDCCRREKRPAPVEYQPRIINSPPGPGNHFPLLPVSGPPPKETLWERLFLSLVTGAVGVLLRLLVDVRVVGRENWQEGAGGFVLANHQSALDPFIIGALISRRIAFLTKSTAFAGRLQRLFLKWAKGLPTTRTATDPPIVYIMRRFLRQGVTVGIFPEAERSWDGTLQPFKLGLVKLLMASGAPVRPVILQNSFQFWPRWAKFPRRASITVHIAAPFSLLPRGASVDEQRRFLEGIFRRRLEAGDAVKDPGRSTPPGKRTLADR